MRIRTAALNVPRGSGVCPGTVATAAPRRALTRRTAGWVMAAASLLLVLAPLATLGCEEIASVDEDKIPQEGEADAATTASSDAAATDVESSVTDQDAGTTPERPTRPDASDNAEGKGG